MLTVLTDDIAAWYIPFRVSTRTFWWKFWGEKSWDSSVSELDWTSTRVSDNIPSDTTDDLVIGCWNMRGFYLKPILLRHHFESVWHICNYWTLAVWRAIRQTWAFNKWLHWLWSGFPEQPSHIIWPEGPWGGGGGVGMLWETSHICLASKLPIDCDCIVRARFLIDSHEPMFILGVYFPSSNHSLDELRETLHLL